MALQPQFPRVLISSAKRFLVWNTLLMLAAAALPAQTAADLFNPDVIHDIWISMDPSDFEIIRNDVAGENKYYPGTFTFGETTLSGVGFRQKGHGSRNNVKPSFKADFDRFKDDQTFLGLKALGLDSSVQDPSQVRQRLSMMIFDRLQVVAPRQAQARVHVNGEYFGLYVIEEDVDKTFLKRVFNENGGNLYEVQGQPSYYFEYLGEDPAAYLPIHFSPESPDDPDATALVGLIRAINFSSDQEFAGAVGQYLDWRQLLTELAVESYLSEFDGMAGFMGINNLYLYQFKDTTRFVFIPKDKDLTFINPYDSVFARFDQNVLLRRAMATPELRQIYLEALLKCAAVTGGANGWFQHTVSTLAEQVREAVYADPNRMCDGSPCTNEDFETAIADEQDYPAIRLFNVQDQVAAERFAPTSAAPKVNAGGVVDAMNYTAPVVAGSLFSIFGTQLAQSTELGDFAAPPLTLGGVQVFVNGYQVPLVYVSPFQVNGWMSDTLETGEHELALFSNGLFSGFSAVAVMKVR